MEMGLEMHIFLFCWLAGYNFPLPEVSICLDRAVRKLDYLF